MNLFTYIVIVQSVALFPGLEMERTWLQAKGPFPTMEECRTARTQEPESENYSQCMPYYQADAIIKPYNQGAFVLEFKKEKS